MTSAVRIAANVLVLLGVVLVCHADDAKTSEVKTESRQIFSPRMGKDVQADAGKDEEAGKHLYERIPPLPKLGKTFDAYLSQYRRDDEESDATSDNFDEIPEDGEDYTAAAGDESKRGGVSMLRMGKRAGVSMLRMGKRAGVSMLRMGRRAGVSMLRMGKREDEGEFERDARGGVSMLRMGRASVPAEEKRGVSMLRMG